MAEIVMSPEDIVFVDATTAALKIFWAAELALKAAESQLSKT